MTQETKPLEYYLGLEYSFSAIADPDGGYVVVFPDLPGCMTQAESLDEIPYMAEDVRVGWLETVYDADPNGIPLPYCGLRRPKGCKIYARSQTARVLSRA